VAAAALGLALRWVAGSRGADNLDTVYYARAVDRYRVAELRPYFPGFPLYILAARAARTAGMDRLAALHLVSGLASLLAAWPLARLAAAWRRAAGGTPGEARESGIAAAVLWCVLPLACLTGTEIASEPLALLAAAVMLLACARFAETHRSSWALAAGLAAGLMCGVRLLHVFLAAPLLAVAIEARRRGVARAPAALATGLAAGVLPWLSWQVAQEGPAFLATGWRQVRQHLATPGFTMLGDGSVWARPARFLASTYTWAFAGGVPVTAPSRIVLAAALVALVALGARRLRAAPEAARLLVLFVAPHVLYVTLGQDVRFPRYVLPLAAMAVVVAAAGLPAPPRGVLLAGVAAGAAVVVTLQASRAHRANEPTEFQLARRLAARTSPASLLVADTRGPMPDIVGEFAPRVHVVPAEPSAGSEVARALAAQGPVYALEPGRDRPEDWTAEARFCAGPGGDGRATPEVWLFRYAPGEAKAELPACASP
jgi:hypothetical protein